MPYGLSEPEIEWVREGYRMFRDGDPAFMDRYEPDAPITIPASLPAGGVYAGPWEAMEFFTTVGELIENPYPDPEEFVRAGDRLIVLGTWRGRSRQTGKEIAIPIVHAFRIRDPKAWVIDNKIISVELFADTAAFLEAIGHPTPG